MGTSWTVSIELSGVDKEKWLRSKVGPSTFDDWPDLLDTEGTPVTVKAVLSALEKASPKCVAWDGDALRGTASLDADGAFWIDRRSHLAAAFRSAGKLGGKGELVIAPAGDNAASDVILVSASGTAKRVTGRAKTSLLERIAPKERAAEQRVVAEVTAAARARPIVSHDGYRAVHEEIVAALRRADRAAVLAASRTVQREIALTRGGAVPFATRYDDAETLLAALEHGDPEAHVWIASTFAAASLDVLALVAPETASELARRILAIGGPVPHGLHSFVDAAVGVAAAGLDTTGQLEALRKHAPRADNRLQLGLFGHPVVARLARGSRDTRDAVRDQITKVLGAPGEWRSISEPDASFGFALAVLLAAHATRVDEKLLAALHTHPHWMVAAAKSPRFQPDRRSRGA